MKFVLIKLNKKIIAILMILIILLICIVVLSNVNAADQEGIKVPIIMYHSILKSRSGKYVTSPEKFEEDLKYIKEHGYTTITMTDLIEHVYNDAKLPEKPIIITFDDGHYNNYYYVVPLLVKYDMKAVISIVGTFTDKFTDTNEVNTNYGYLRWLDISMLIPEGIVEFQNHSYDMHNSGKRNGSKKKIGESIEKYTRVLTEDTMKLQEEFQENSFYKPNTYTYPFGAISKESKEIIKRMGFRASLSCKEGINYITKDREGLFSLKRYNRNGRINTEKFFKKIEDKM